MAEISDYDMTVFEDDRGWTHLRGILAASAAAELAAACFDRLAELGDDLRVGDKPSSGTRRLVDLDERAPLVRKVLDHPLVRSTIEAILGPTPTVGEAIFRCPFPGFGQQKLHADDLPLTDVNQTRGLTAIMPLVDFTENNGATRIVAGSHRRPDLQRLGGNLDRHDDEQLLLGRAGDLFVFSRHLLHSGTKNKSSEPRPALQITWAR